MSTKQQINELLLRSRRRESPQAVAESKRESDVWFPRWTNQASLAISWPNKESLPTYQLLQLMDIVLNTSSQALLFCFPLRVRIERYFNYGNRSMLTEFSFLIPPELLLILIRVQAVGQLCSTASMTANLAQCQTLVQKAVSAGAKVRQRRCMDGRGTDSSLLGVISARSVRLYWVLGRRVNLTCTPGAKQ